MLTTHAGIVPAKERYGVSNNSFEKKCAQGSMWTIRVAFDFLPSSVGVKQYALKLHCALMSSVGFVGRSGCSTINCSAQCELS